MEKLNPECFYHIYNRAVGGDNLFIEHNDYSFFIKRMSDYLLPVMELYAYALLNNHFHLCVRVRSEEVISEILDDERFYSDETDISNYISRQFSHLFNSYSQAFNNKHKRTGGLFQRPFKRKIVNDEGYLKKLIHYINYNPVKHGFTQKPYDWRYSSYNEIVYNVADLISRKEVLEIFHDVENFKYCHLIDTTSNFTP